VKIPAGFANGIAVADGAVWVSGGSEAGPNGIWKLDADTGQVLRRAYAGDVLGVFAAYGSLWTGEGPDTVVRLDRTGRALARIRGTKGEGFAATPGALWAGRTRIDPRTNSVVGHVPGRFSARGLVAGYGSLWIGGQVVKRVDPRTRRVVARIYEPGFKGATLHAAGAGGIWVVYSGDATGGSHLTFVDPRTNRPSGRRVALGDDAPVGIAVARGRVWVLSNDGKHPGLLLRGIDPAARRFVGRALRVQEISPFDGLAAAGESLYLAGDNRVSRISLPSG
jgi:hypothetical protein